MMSWNTIWCRNKAVLLLPSLLSESVHFVLIFVIRKKGQQNKYGRLRQMVNCYPFNQCTLSERCQTTKTRKNCPKKWKDFFE